MADKYSQGLSNRLCILCGGNDFSQISTQMRKGPQLTTVICKQCSLVFTNPIPVSEVYNSFYVNDYEKFYGKSTASKPAASAEPSIFSIIGNFINIKISDYLEIGPGRGLTLYHANNLFNKTMGVEPSVDFTNLLVKEYGLNVVNSTFEEFITGYKNKVDVVSMFHVLEHIYDPYEGLMSIRNILHDDGLVVIEVPNILKPFRSLDNYFLRFVHLYNFSPKTLKALLIKSGFDILYEDFGGDDWFAPQNITMIGRKAQLKQKLEIEFEEEVSNVVAILDRYRTLYTTSLKFKWLLFDRTRIPLKYFRKVKYKLKATLLKFLRMNKRVNSTKQ